MPVPRQSEKISRLSAKERIYQTLKEWIIEGVLLPHEKLVDAELCDFFSVSRTPIREAFQLLEAQNLVEIQPGKATIVTAIDLKSLREWYMPLAYLQGLAAELACENAREEDYSELDRLNKAFEEAIQKGGTKDILEADRAFHRKILALAGNPYVTDFSETLFLHVQRIEHTYYRWTAKSNQSAITHHNLIEAMKRKEATAAGIQMKQNWLYTMALYEEEQIHHQFNPGGIPT